MADREAVLSQSDFRGRLVLFFLRKLREKGSVKGLSTPDSEPMSQFELYRDIGGWKARNRWMGDVAVAKSDHPASRGLTRTLQSFIPIPPTIPQGTPLR